MTSILKQDCLAIETGGVGGKALLFCLAVCALIVSGLQAADIIELEGRRTHPGLHGAIVANFSPDGKKVVTGYEDGTVRIWDVDSKTELRMLSGHSQKIWSAVFSPDGKKILTASRDGTTRIWDADSGETLRKLEREKLPGHDKWDFSAIFSSDSKKVITIGTDRIARIWDAESGMELRRLTGINRASGADGRRAIFSPDGKHIIAINSYETSQIKPEKYEEYEKRIRESHHGSLIPIDEEDIIRTIQDNSIHIWDAETGKELKKIEMEGHTREVTFIDISPDGKKIVTAGHDGTARIWDVESGVELKKLEGHTHWMVNVAHFSLDGNTILTQSFDGTLRIWDVNSGKELQKLSKYAANVCYYAVFSPDGKRVVAANSDGITRIWTLER